MQVQVSVFIDEVEEDADIEIIRKRVQAAVQISMPFHTVSTEVEGTCEAN